MEYKEAEVLLTKYNTGQCTDAEKAIVEQWVMQYNEEGLDISPERIEELGKQIYTQLPDVDKKKPVIKLWTIVSTVAATIVIAIGVWILNPSENTHIKKLQTYDIAAGGNRATITLSNGQRIPLNTNQKGIIVSSAGLTYDDGSKINATDLAGIQTITTPKGGEYKMTLPDGTKVWLNAASTLQFQSSFDKKGQRKVTLKNGEAYFEVAKDRMHPFVVQTENQEVRVLGTHFNINSYESASIKTTLLEGSVKVLVKKSTHLSDSKIIVPGEQATCSVKGITVKKVDVDLETSWKNGRIQFEDAELKTIMAMLERWYNIEVVYQGTQTTSRFNGSVSRTRNISEVLSFLESTGKVHFKIEERRIIIMD